MELDRLSREKRQLEEHIEDLKKGLGLKKQQYTHEHALAHRLNHQIKSFKTDLQDAITYFQDPALLKVISLACIPEKNTHPNLIYRNQSRTFARSTAQSPKTCLETRSSLN